MDITEIKIDTHKGNVGKSVMLISIEIYFSVREYLGFGEVFVCA